MNRLKIVLWNLKRFFFGKCSVEIHISEHCNLNCVGCSHYSPLAEPAFCDLEDLDNNLRKLSKIRKSIRIIRLLGGEPLLNPDVTKAFELVRNYLGQVKIELVTNGLLLKSGKLPCSFWEELKRYNVTLCLTKYPINIDYTKLVEYCKGKGVQTEIYNSPHGRFSLFKLDRYKISGRKNYYRCEEKVCFQLVSNRIFSCAQSAYVGYLNKTFGCDFKHERDDYIIIDNINYFKFLGFRLLPRSFCKYCVFPRQDIDWKRSECKPEEWLELNVKTFSR